MITDIAPEDLPPEAWTIGNNVRFIDNKVVSTMGYDSIYETALDTPQWLLPAESSTIMWAYPSTNKVYATNGVSHADITRTVGGDYIGTADDLWNGAMLGNIGILNNGIDIPQVWINPGLGAPLADLANWPASTSAKVMRSFKQFLIAGNVNKPGGQYPQMIKWSHPADPNAVPSSWDETDATKDAGEWNLLQSEGEILTFAPLKDSFLIYKDDSVHYMRYIGGRFIFDFESMFDTMGALSQRSVKRTKRGDRHIVMGRTDILIHDGTSIESLLDDKMRRWYAGQLDPESYHRAFLVPYYDENEYWACFRSNSANGDYCDKALVINFQDGTITPHDVPDATHAGWDYIDPTVADSTYDAKDVPIDDVPGRIGQAGILSGTRRIIWLSGDDKFYLQDEGLSANGSNIDSYIQRTGIAIAGVDRNKMPKADASVVKHLTEVWPYAEVEGGEHILISVGAQQQVNGSIEWQGPFEFRPGEEESIQPDIEGRLLAIRFETDQVTYPGSRMKIARYDLGLNPVGAY